MICVKAEITKEICNIDDELKLIYHSEKLYLNLDI